MHFCGSKFKVYPGKLSSRFFSLATWFLSPGFLGNISKCVLSIYGVTAGNRWYSQVNQFKERGYLHSRERCWEALSHSVVPRS